MNNKAVKTLVIFLAIIGTASIGKVVYSAFTVKDWNKPNLSTVKCEGKNLILNKDIEGNNFIFYDISDNNNLKVSEITFKEESLGIKSYAIIKENSKPNIVFTSKNNLINDEDKKILINCFTNTKLEVFDNAKFK